MGIQRIFEQKVLYRSSVQHGSVYAYELRRSKYFPTFREARRRKSFLRDHVPMKEQLENVSPIGPIDSLGVQHPFIRDVRPNVLNKVLGFFRRKV